MGCRISQEKSFDSAVFLEILNFDRLSFPCSVIGDVICYLLQFRGLSGPFLPFPVAFISVISCVSQARRLLKQLKFEKRCIWAVGVIHKYFLGWRVRREYRCKFKATAGPKIVNFIYNALVSATIIARYLVVYHDSDSALEWPPFYQDMGPNPPAQLFHSNENHIIGIVLHFRRMGT